MSPELSRRHFLGLMGTMAGAGMVSACTPRTATAGLTQASTATSSATPAPSTSPRAQLCATPTPIPVPQPKPVGTSFDVYAHYLYFRGLTDGGIGRTGYGFATVTPLYGEQQDPLTMKMDIKWAREHGINVLTMPVAIPDSYWEKRIDEWFIPASQPPFDINYSLMFNPQPFFPWDSPAYPLNQGAIRIAREFISRHVRHPRYKRLPDGRPVVFYFLPEVVAYWLGVDVLEETVELLRGNLGEDIFLVGELMLAPYQVQTDDDPQHQSPDYIRRQVEAFDAISSYYMERSGYRWHSDQEYRHVVTPFKDLIKGYDEACRFWGEKAHKYGAKLVPPIAPTGISTRLLYEAGLDSDLIDRHEGVSYDTAKEMAEVGATYADPELKMVLVSAWNECNEGAAIVPSKGYGFGPARAVRDTFAIEPPGGWPNDYYPPEYVAAM